MFIERDIVLCLFHFQYFVQLHTWFTYLTWTVLSVVCSVLFCGIVMLSFTVFSVYCTVHCSCIVLCLLVMYVLLT
jgi:hypothetical protein